MYTYMWYVYIAKALALDTRRRKSPWKHSNIGKRHQPIIAPSSM